MLCVCLVTQLCPTLCGPMDCSPPGSSAHGIFQAKILEWGAIPSSRGPSQARDRIWIFCIGRQILYHWVIWEAALGAGISKSPLVAGVTWLRATVPNLTTLMALDIIWSDDSYLFVDVFVASSPHQDINSWRVGNLLILFSTVYPTPGIVPGT